MSQLILWNVCISVDTWLYNNSNIIFDIDSNLDISCLPAEILGHGFSCRPGPKELIGEVSYSR